MRSREKATFSDQLSSMSSPSSTREQFTLSFYVPPSSLEACKDAIFSAGAGCYPGGNYTRACFVTEGTGQFLPNEGASPNIGSVGNVETVREIKVETICVGRDVIMKAVEELKRAHPYEEVGEVLGAHEVWYADGCEARSHIRCSRWRLCECRFRDAMVSNRQ